MKASVNNLKFNYLYRDAGNYKVYDEIIFANQNTHSLPEFELIIRNHLIEGEFFIPGKWHIPRLKLGSYSSELDHDYHEFESLEFTDENQNANCDITDFLNRIIN